MQLSRIRLESFQKQSFSQQLQRQEQEPEHTPSLWWEPSPGHLLVTEPLELTLGSHRWKDKMLSCYSSKKLSCDLLPVLNFDVIWIQVEVLKFKSLKCTLAAVIWLSKWMVTSKSSLLWLAAVNQNFSALSPRWYGYIFSVSNLCV